MSIRSVRIIAPEPNPPKVDELMTERSEGIITKTPPSGGVFVITRDEVPRKLLLHTIYLSFKLRNLLN